MKRLLLFSLLGFTASNAMAQRSAVKLPSPSSSEAIYQAGIAANKTTSDSVIYNSVISSSATPSYYTYSGTYYGTLAGINIIGMQGFAQRFDLTAADSSVEVLGVYAWFHGSYASTTTKTVEFDVWSQGAAETYTNITYTGFPATALATRSGVSIKDLGINSTLDTPKVFYFATPTAALNDSFFVGYKIAYTATAPAGDTIGLFTTADGDRVSSPYTVSGTDTLVNDQNAVLYTDGYWYDQYFDYSGMAVDFYILPVVNIKNPTSVSGISRRNFTLYGNYPNPATNETTVRFALKAAADVTITLMDLTGKQISVTKDSGLTVGEHTATINTAKLPSGNYIYLIRTSSGDGIASQFSVIR